MENLDPRVTALNNGMRLIEVGMPGISSVTVLVMVGVGSRYEQPKLAGISHFLEHLPFKGTKKFPDAMAVATAIDNVGGKHNAFTSKDHTGYWVKVAANHLDLGLDVVSDLLLEPKLKDKDIERERGVIIEEINMYEDNPQYKVGSVFDELVYKGSQLAMDIAGTKATVSKISQKDFLDHYKAYYDPTNVVIGVVGNIQKKAGERRDLVEKYFSKGNKRRGGGEKIYGLPKQTKPRIRVFYKKTEQAHFHLGFPCLGFMDERRYALSVLTTLLGGNSSSRLFNEIREKRGLAYYAYASSDMVKETGSVFAFEGVALNQVEDAIKVTIEEFGKVKNKVTDEEVNRAKEFLVGKLALDLEDSANMANMMVRKLLLEGQVQTVAEIRKKIQAVDKTAVVAVANQLFDYRKFNLALIGPFKDEGKFGKLIGLT